MKVIYTITAMLATVATQISANCANFNPGQDALANALQNIFSSANTDKAMNMIQMAANRQVHNPAPWKEEKIVNIDAAPPNRRIVPIGTFQRPAALNAGQFVKQAPPNIALNLQNLAELISLNAKASQNPVMPEIAMPNMPIIILTTSDIPQAPITKDVSCPCASLTPLVNPFWPAASPVSAWTTPRSSLLPPVSQPRGQFLRKIPIPPPTL